MLTVFPDGRTIVGGTDDVATARTVHAQDMWGRERVADFSQFRQIWWLSPLFAHLCLFSFRIVQ